jgi:hypothetical protein
MPRTAYRIRILPEPMSRNGLSLVRNGAFTPLRSRRSRPAPSTSHKKTPVNPFDSRLLRSPSVSRPIKGDLIAGHPLSTRISRALPTSTASTPLQAFRPSGSKRSTAPVARSSLRRMPDSPLLPAAIFLRFAHRINAPDSPHPAQRIVP